MEGRMIARKLLTPAATVKEWEKLLKEFERVRVLEMKKKPKDRKKRNLRKGPGGRVARTYAAKAGMKSMGEVYCTADMNRRKIKCKYENEKLDYSIESTYTPDWTLANDVLVEYKGKMTDQTRTKLLAVKRCNPDRRVCIVFERATNKLSSRPNSWRYWEWAEKNGFEWSESVVKKEWCK
jgi:hypothetical protein